MQEVRPKAIGFELGEGVVGCRVEKGSRKAYHKERWSD